MRNVLLIIAGLVVLVIIAWFGSRMLTGFISNSPTKPTPTPTVLTSRTTPTPIPLTPGNPDVSYDLNITYPSDNSIVSSPFLVEGFTNSGDDTVFIELRDSFNNLLYSGSAYALHNSNRADRLFEQKVQFVTDSPSGMLYVYQIKPNANSRINQERVPLQFN